MTIAACAALGTVLVTALAGCGGNESATPTLHAIPVVACKGQTMTGDPPPAPPDTVDARLTDDTAKAVSFYSFDGTIILAPSGWMCDGASGSGGASVKAWDESKGFHRSSSGGFEPEEAVTGYIATPSSNHPLYLACAWFEDAAASLAEQGIAPCDQEATPLGETQTHVDYDELRFTDPPGVTGTGTPSGGRNPSRGFVLWVAPPTPGEPNNAATATCVLPPKMQPICTAILADFRTRFLTFAAS